MNYIVFYRLETEKFTGPWQQGTSFKNFSQAQDERGRLIAQGFYAEIIGTERFLREGIPVSWNEE